MHVYIMVGVSGSGKSTYADYLLQQVENPNEVLILSSDDIRKEMYGSLYDNQTTEQSNAVAKEMNDRLERIVKSGLHEHIIYDATNPNRKKRRALYNNIKDWTKNNSNVHIMYFSMPYQHLLDINNQRAIKEPDKYIPEDKLKQMYCKMQVPRRTVDCDTIYVFARPMFKTEILDSYSDDGLQGQFTDFAIKSLVSGNELNLLNSSHDNYPHHMESINEHIEMCIRWARLKFPDEERLLNIAKFHDLGKSFTKEFNERGKANYYDHANVSANYYLNYLASKNKVDTPHMEVVEAIFQHMNGLDKAGLGENNIRRNKLSEELISLIHTFSMIDQESRLTPNKKVFF